MERRTIIIIICLIGGLGGMGYHFYSEHAAKVERERVAHEVAVKAATEKEKKAAAELKRLQDKEQESARKVADLERQQQQVPTGPTDNTQVVGPLKPAAVPPGSAKAVGKRQSALLGDGPTPGQPVPPIIPAAEKFIAEARLTSTSLDTTTPYAVINRQTYRVGNRIVVAPGQELTVTSIEDGYITFTGGPYTFKMRLTSMNQ
jgi:hypothetical protein